MIKRNDDSKHNPEETFHAYKKSNHTVCIKSRTGSEVTNMTAGSGITLVKKKTSKVNGIYNSEEFTKRDLSMETDMCILRRYYKKRRHKLGHRDTLSSKSKYSCCFNKEMNIIDEAKPDESACGDNENSPKMERLNPFNNLDVSTLILENLKILLRTWICKHIFDENATDRKVTNLLNSILNKLDLEKTDENSCCSTYTLQNIEDEIKNAAGITFNRTSNNALEAKISSEEANWRSRYTIPFLHKRLKTISTLSIPRNLSKSKRDKIGNLVKKTDKNIIAIKKPCTLHNSTGNSTVTCSVNTPIKGRIENKFQNLQYNQINEQKNIPKFVNKGVSTGTSKKIASNKFSNDFTVNSLHTIQCLIKSIFAESENNSSSNIYYDDNLKHKKVVKPGLNLIHQPKKNAVIQTIDAPRIRLQTFRSRFQQTLNIVDDRDCNQATETPDFGSAIFYAPKKEASNVSNMTFKENGSKSQNVFNNKTKVRSRKRIGILSNKKATLNAPNFKSVQFKHFSCLYSKNKRQLFNENEFITHLQNIFKYFSDYKANKDIKLNIDINVFPASSDINPKGPDINVQDFKPFDSARKSTVVYNVDPNPYFKHYQNIEVQSDKESCQNTHPKIIPLLDSAVSHDKYLFNKDWSSERCDLKYKTELKDRETLTADFFAAQDIAELKTIVKDLVGAAQLFITEHFKNKINNEIEKSDLKKSHMFNTNVDAASQEKSKTLAEAPTSSKPIHEINTPAALADNEHDKLSEVDTSELREIIKRYDSYKIIDSETVLRVTDMTSAANKELTISKAKFVDEGLTCCLPVSKNLFDKPKIKKHSKLLAVFFGNQNNDFICKKCKGTLLYDTDYNKSKKYSEPQNNPNNRTRVSSVCVNMGDSGIRKRYSAKSIWKRSVYCLLICIPIITIAYLLYDYTLREIILSKIYGFFKREDKLNKFSQNGLKLSDLGF